MTTTRTFPGMLDASKEYFTTPHEVMMIQNGRIMHFDKISEHPELQQIIDDEPELRSVLTRWFGDDHQKKLKTLARCRFGALNFTADFDGENSTTDYCNCPHRGSCIGENIVCKPPVVNGQQLTFREVELLREVAGNDKNTAIADKLGYAEGTFKQIKTGLYKRCRFITKQHAAITLFLEGLL